MAARTEAPAGPRPDVLQRHALHALHAHLGDHGRGVVVMPCGSGKTLLGRWLAEQLLARLTVVFVPSLALVPQTVLVYRAGAAWRHATMIACSDETSGRAVAVDDLDLPLWARSSVTASTSSREVQAFVAGPGTRLIVSTYHSAPRVAAALQRARVTADLVVCDEAHRLTGRPRREFRSVLEAPVLPARRRLFLTATPVEAAAWEADVDLSVTGPLSLDDEDTFGPTIYRATFADAVAVGRLVDYDVEVVAVRDTSPSGAGASGSRRSVGATDAAVAAVTAGARRVLTYHSRVAHARQLAADLDGHRLPNGGTIRAEHLESRHRARRRAEALHRLAHPADGDAAVLASARVLTEGVDVPAVDTVLFAEPRTSTVDIVQAVGRAMRWADGKTRGRVVLAVTLPSTVDEDTELSGSAWRHVWLTLRALADMDPRFAHTLRTLATGGRAPAGPARSGPTLQLDLPEGVDRQEWILRAVDRSGGAWLRHFDALRSWVRVHGHARPRTGVTQVGVPIGQWVAQQRALHRAGALRQQQVDQLQALPGWAWSAWESAWWSAAGQWLVAHRTGRVVPGRGDRWARLEQLPGHPSLVHAGNTGRLVHAYRTLAAFAIDTCTRRRLGTLPSHLAAAADQLPHWRWHLLTNDDAAMVDALVEYAAWKGDHNPPHDYRHDDDLPLGSWLTAVRRRRFTGGLDPLLERHLTLAQGRTPGASALRWEPSATSWRLAYLALRQYQQREGTCRVRDQHVEALPDHQVALWVWCRRQRHLYRHGQMVAERAAALQQIPGWAWEIGLRDDYRPVLDEATHGTRAGYAKGCLCSPCTDANGSYELARTNGAATDLVDAAPVRGHVRLLRGRGGTQRAIARAAKVNVKTVAECEDGTVNRLRPENAAAILAVTLDDCWAHAGNSDKIPAAPTWELLDPILDRGWPKAWISRELGQRGGALQLGRDWITRRNAVAIADLAARLGTRRPPPRPQRGRLPTLAELDAAGAA